MMISKENLKEVKEKLFNENISLEEKNKILEKINLEVEKILSELNEESEPIDE